MQYCHNNFSCTYTFFRVNVSWNTPAIITNAPMAVTGKTEATGSTIHFKPSPEVFAITEFKYDI
jgi:DNA gyrase/topoisomerase IV subunit B